MLVVLLLVYEWVDCLVIKFVKMLDLRFERNLFRIDGVKKKGYLVDQVEREMNDYLKEKFNDYYRVVVIYCLEFFLFLLF